MYLYYLFFYSYETYKKGGISFFAVFFIGVSGFFNGNYFGDDAKYNWWYAVRIYRNI